MKEADCLRRTRTGYDLTASAYAEGFHHHLRDKPLDRAIIGGFAGLVGLNGNRPIADVGCGTGATTGMFRDYGIDAIGIDLSPNMAAQAGRRNPTLAFHVGSMNDLPFGDNRFIGCCARAGTSDRPSKVSLRATFHSCVLGMDATSPDF